MDFADNKLDIAGALQRLTNPHLPSTLSGVVNATASAAFSEDESPFSPGMMDTVMKVGNMSNKHGIRSCIETNHSIVFISWVW